MPTDEVRLPWPYTQGELAGMIGGSRQSVNRLLADLVSRGVLRFEGDELVVPDPRRLAEAAATMSDGTRHRTGRPSTGRSTRSSRSPPGWPRPTASRRRPTSRPLAAIADAAVVAVGRHGRVDRPVRRRQRPPRVPGRGRPRGWRRRRPERGRERGHRRVRVLDRPGAGDRRRRSRSALRAGHAPSATGYLPRSLLAVPLVDDAGSDRRHGGCSTGATAGRSTCADIELAAAVRGARRRSWPGHVASIATPSGCCAPRSSAWPPSGAGADGLGPAAIETLLDGAPPKPRPTTTRCGAWPTGSPACARPIRTTSSSRSTGSTRCSPTGAPRIARVADDALAGGGDERSDPLPAWSEAFAADARSRLGRERPFGTHGPGRACSATRTVRASPSPSSTRASKPIIRRSAAGSSGSLRVELDGDDGPGRRRPRRGATWSGHGTACAGHHPRASHRPPSSCRSASSAPTTAGKGRALAAAIDWAIGRGDRGRQPQPLVTQRVDGRRASTSSRTVLLREHAARLRRQQRAGAVLPIAVRGVVSVAAHDVARSRHVVLQPVAAGRVRRLRRRRRRRVARRRADPGDRQLVRGAAPRRAGGARLRSRYPEPARSRSRRCSRRRPTDPPDMNDTAREVGRCRAGCG